MEAEALTIAEEPGLILEQGEKPLTPEREEKLRIPEQGEELLILEREEEPLTLEQGEELRIPEREEELRIPEQAGEPLILEQGEELRILEQEEEPRIPERETELLTEAEPPMAQTLAGVDGSYGGGDGSSAEGTV